MKKTYFFIFIIILFLILSLNASALKINFKDKDNRVFFEPNLYKEISFYVDDAERVATVPIKLEGELAKYASVEPDKLSLRPGEGKSVLLKLQLPKDIPKGVHSITVSATEVPVDAPDSAFILMPAVGMNIKIINTDVDYNCNLGVFTVNMNSNNVQVTLNVGNDGLKKVNDAYAEFSFYDENDNFLTSWKTNKFSVPAFESNTVRSSAVLSSVPPGYYRLEGALYCGGEKIDLKKDVTNFPKDLEVYDFKITKSNKVKFEFDLENKFDVPVSAYAMMWFYEDGKHIDHLTMPTVKIEPNTRKKYQLSLSFSDLNLPAGNYDVKGKLFHSGKMETHEGKLVITDEDVEKDFSGKGSFNVLEKEKKTVVLEKPSGFSFSGRSIIRILAAAAILAVILLFIFKKFHKKEIQEY